MQMSAPRLRQVSPAVKEAAIRLLDEPSPFLGGDIGETGTASSPW